MRPDINKFSIPQMTSNSDGKTSASGTMGVLTMTAGVLGFLVGAVEYFIDENSEIMTQSIIVLTIGAGLLGYRRSKDGPVQDAPAAQPAPAEQTNTQLDQPTEEQINS